MVKINIKATVDAQLVKKAQQHLRLRGMMGELSAVELLLYEILKQSNILPTKENSGS